MSKLPATAQYLLRIDDLCPTVHAQRWRRIADLVRKHGIRPILAVVPDNCDPELTASAPDPGFWTTMREMEQEGAAIALHGYRHLCEHRGRSLLPLHRAGEFAGVPFELQRQWIRAGLSILRGHGLEPKLWVAPRHSFDYNTLRALREEKREFLSDGLARRPFFRGGMVWIPQQLWGPAEKDRGLWTICIHPNSFGRTQLQSLEEFVAAHAAQFTWFECVAQNQRPDTLTWAEAAWERIAVARLRIRRALRGQRHGRRSR